GRADHQGERELGRRSRGVDDGFGHGEIDERRDTGEGLAGGFIAAERPGAGGAIDDLHFLARGELFDPLPHLSRAGPGPLHERIPKARDSCASRSSGPPRKVVRVFAAPSASGPSTARPKTSRSLSVFVATALSARAAAAAAGSLLLFSACWTAAAVRSVSIS